MAMVALTALLLWLSLRSLAVGEGQDKGAFLWATWSKSDKVYLLLMAVVAMVSHVLRAERWRMLLRPTGHAVSLTASFLSLMIGYLVNLAIPRGGEISRCVNLRQLEKTPVEISFGTVVVERIVDVLCLLLLLALAFAVEWDKLFFFIQSLPWRSEGALPWPWILALSGALLLAVVAYRWARKHARMQQIIRGFRDGLLSVAKLNNKWLFVGYSIAIWALYFLMSYFIVLAFPETSRLGPGAVLTLFAIGSIAMAAPLPGGAGSYHTLVPLGLVALYALPEADAIAFVFVFHAWQTFIMIVAGILSLAVSYALIRWKKPNPK
jgi:hypothetical protein